MVNVSRGDTKPGKDYEVGSLTASPEKVRITGPKTLINKIDKVNASIELDGNTEDFTQDVNLTIIDKNQEVLTDSEMNSLRIENNAKVTVTAKLWKIRQGVQISADYVGTPAEGYQVGAVRTVPDTISVAGSTEGLESLADNNNVITIPEDSIDISGESEDVEKKISLTNLLPDNVKLTSDSSEDVNFHEYDLLIEGIFGVGLSREVGGVYKEVIERINACGKPVIAIDIPSGISGDSGKILGCAVHASSTVTFGGYKRGHLLYPGREYCGDIKLVSIGFHNQTIKKYATGYILEESDHLMPERKAYSNKGSYGKILIIAGNETMSGAACFAAEAALRMGAGLVKVLSDAGNRQILQTRLPEILFGERKDLEESLEWCDCILFGPGVGVSEEMKEMLEMVLKKGKKPLVIDADGLNIISRFNMKIDYPYGTIMTPHLMEAARLMSCDITQIKEDLCQSAQDLAEKYHCTAVLKDATTIVAREDDLVYINQSGNDGMATGGSGDVLAGMITGLLGEGLSVHEAAVHGVYLHGLAGDHAKHDLGAYSMIASDIIAHIKDVTGGNYEPVL